MKKLNKLIILILLVTTFTSCDKKYTTVDIYAMDALFEKRQGVYPLKSDGKLLLNKSTVGWECLIMTTEADEPLGYMVSCTNWINENLETFKFNQECHKHKSTIRVTSSATSTMSKGALELSFVCR